MAIQNFPAALQPIIQQGFLEREFQSGIQSILGFRAVADREAFPNKIGETVIKTRRGLKAPVTTPLTPSANTNLDNGLTPSGWTVEQYSLSINMYGDTIDLNMITQGVGIASQFVENAKVNGVQSAQSLDRLARNALYAKYLEGNTFVKTTLGAPATSLAVDDVRGFQFVLVQGVPTAVSGGNPLAITVNGVAASVTAVAVDGSNTSTAAAVGGISGVLTTAANVAIVDGTLGNAVKSSVAPAIVRPASRTSHRALQVGDLLTMSAILDGVTVLRNNGVPTIDGRYNFYMDPTSARQLFADADFKLLYQGATAASSAFAMGMPIDMLGVRLIPTTESYLQAHAVTAGLVVRRPILVGKGALIEGDFENLAHSDVDVANSVVQMVEGIAQVTRAPLDRLAQIIAQSWYWIGGFAVPSDMTANPTIIPTASNALYKRGVIIEHAS